MAKIYLADLKLKFPAEDWQHGHYNRGLSLLHGWLPLVINIILLIFVIYALSQRRAAWYRTWMPLCVIFGALATWAIYSYLFYSGMMNDNAPQNLWWWIAIGTLMLGVVIVGWRHTSWLKRTITIIATLISTIGILLSLNEWVGYYPSVQTAWSAITSGPLPDSINQDELPGLQGKGEGMKHGVVMEVDSPTNLSNFDHRSEYVYLPPAYFLPSQPHLPVVLMIGGEFNTPSDWIRSGDAITVIDDYANDHHGWAPILAFVDVSGAFNNDTECVDGSRGNTATHINQEFRPYIVHNFRADTAAASWAVMGWSMGGTCAISLTTLNPQLYTTYVSVLGDANPNAGNPSQTLQRLFGGNKENMEKFDSYQGLNHNKGAYSNSQGLIITTKFSKEVQERIKKVLAKLDQDISHPGFGGRDDAMLSLHQDKQVQRFCSVSKAVGFNCHLTLIQNSHSWLVAKYFLYKSLPWIAFRQKLPYTTAVQVDSIH